MMAQLGCKEAFRTRFALQQTTLSEAMEGCSISSDGTATSLAAPSREQSQARHRRPADAHGTPALDLADHAKRTVSCDSTPPNLPSVPSSAQPQQPCASPELARDTFGEALPTAEPESCEPQAHGQVTPTSNTLCGTVLPSAAQRLIEKRGLPFAFHHERRYESTATLRGAPETVAALRQPSPTGACPSPDVPPWDSTTEVPPLEKPQKLQAPVARKPAVPRHRVAHARPITPVAQDTQQPRRRKPPLPTQAVPVRYQGHNAPEQNRSPALPAQPRSPFGNAARDQGCVPRRGEATGQARRSGAPGAGRDYSRSVTPVDCGEDTGALCLQPQCMLDLLQHPCMRCCSSRSVAVLCRTISENQ